MLRKRREHALLITIIRNQKEKDKIAFGGFFKKSRKAIYGDAERNRVASDMKESNDNESCTLEVMLEKAESLVHDIEGDPNRKEDYIQLKDWIDGAQLRLSCRKGNQEPSFDFKYPSEADIEEAQKFGIDLRDDKVVEMLENLKNNHYHRLEKGIEDSDKKILNSSRIQSLLYKVTPTLQLLSSKSKESAPLYLLHLCKLSITIFVCFRAFQLILVLVKMKM